MDKRICAICAWRGTCQKRFTVQTDALLNVHCPDFTRDVTLKNFRDVEEAVMDKPVSGKGGPRNVEKLVEEQLQKWRLRMEESEQELEKVTALPVITISREAGSRGSEVARRVAAKLGMDLMGGQILQHVAESTKMTRKVIESLDEKDLRLRDVWLGALFDPKHLSPDVYFRHLVRVIGTIGRYGNALIVGRGAHFILPRETTFRVRITAPLEMRIRNVMAERNYSGDEAERYVTKTESNRRAFMKKNFRADIADPANYDLVVNMQSLGISGAVNAIIASFETWKKTR
ncbi:MAG: cytidylate kinase-like family protein [Deltaproteobacteria bacterium]|nr:cytidylate kinase-like family protein [Deltaproteobacteria bacterium]